MKMVKSLLLGTAAGLVAMTGAQAADLPVKAKPVQYVKICSLYGAGFYYIPGTDTCIKIGGFVRAEENFNAQGSFGLPNNVNYTRSAQTEYTRTRFIITADARSQTEYGTLRSYGRGGFQWTSGDYQVGGSAGGSNVAGNASVGSNSFSGGVVNGSSTTYFDRAFIQIAGFTFGKTQSFFDFFNAGDFSNETPYLWMDTGGSGTPVIAYTAQFGNGVSATLSAEDYTEQALPVVNVSATGGTVQAKNTFVNSPNCGLLNPGSDCSSNHANDGIPDIIANLRIDQGWGSAQIMGALHDDRATYYSGSGNVVYGSPADVWGYALGAGVKFNVPQLGAGDVVSVAANYCHGASRYCSNPNGGVRGAGSMYAITDGTSVGFGNLADAYYAGTAGGATTGLELPNAWNVAAGYAHHWDAKWQTSLYGGYLKYEANSGSADIWCTGSANNLGITVGPPNLGNGCRNWSAWQVGTRTLWNPVANLDISVDILYHKIDGALQGLVVAGPTGSGNATVTYGDVGTWSGIFRVQRNFYP